MRYKAFCFATASSFALLIASPAYAQDAGAPSAGTPTADESDTQENVGASEIVVVAQRRAERSQDVPVTVFAASESVLADANIQNIQEIGKLVTGVQLGRGATSVMPFIRGVGTSQRSVPAESSVAAYIDGVYIPRLNPAMLRLNSISSVEVLKGPQGTLFGRNSSGGLIHIITKTPEPGAPSEGKAEIGYGNFDTITATGYGATSLGDNAALDFAFSVYDQGDGWGDNPITGRDIYLENSVALRSKLVLTPGPATRIILSGDYVDSDSSMGFLTNYRGRTQGYLSSGPLGQQIRPVTGFYDNEANSVNSAKMEIWGVSGRLEHEFDAFTLISTTSYRHSANNYFVDADASRVDAINLTFADEIATSFFEELLLQSNPGSSFDWSLGFFYGDIGGKFTPGYQSGQLIDAGFGAGNTNVYYSEQKTRTIAGFGQVSVPLGENTKVTAGGRITRDRIRASGYRVVGIGGAPPAAPVNPIPGSEREARDSYTKFSWRLALDHKFTPDIMAYASASSGFKASIFSLQPLTDTTPASPETVTAYEAGLKTTLFDRKLRFNIAGFYSKLRDLQVSIVPAPAVIVTRNVPGARSYGFEVDASASLASGLDLRAGYAYVNSRYTSYPQAPYFFPNPAAPYGNLPAVAGDADGNWTERSPRHTFNLGGSYEIPVGSNGDTLTLNANYAYTGSFYWHPNNLTRQKSYGLLDGQIKYTFGDPRVHIALWGANLTNRKYYIEAVEQAGPTGVGGAPAAPRTYGVKVGFEF